MTFQWVYVSEVGFFFPITTRLSLLSTVSIYRKINLYLQTFFQGLRGSSLRAGKYSGSLYVGSSAMGLWCFALKEKLQSKPGEKNVGF